MIGARSPARRDRAIASRSRTGKRGTQFRRAWLFAVALAGSAGSIRGVAAEEQDYELSGYVGAEARLFTRSPQYPGQSAHQDFSLVGQPELYWSWDDGRYSVAFTPFVRLDSVDQERTHADLRELLWKRSADTWDLRIGVGKVFWGVTESVHVVDVINQTDLVENIDGEEKLGQPMVNLSVYRDWGTLDLFVLPYFRERTFPGRAGRLRTSPPVDTGAPIYTSSREQWHPDLAVRWSHAIGPLDIGLAHFHGTSRNPDLLSGTDAEGRPALIPAYDLMDQTGLDLQVTLGEWLLKFEGIRQRTDRSGTFYAFAGGFEYTFVGAFGTAADVGLLAEYLHDTRGERSLDPFEDDLFAGIRIVANDAQSTTLLAGVIQDLDGDATVLSIEASRRIGDRWRLGFEARAWQGVAVTDIQYTLRGDDYVQFTLLRYF